jgi:hypothetical protein
MREVKSTYLPTCLPTLLPTYPPCMYACMIHTCMHTYMHACIPTYLPTYLPSYLPTYLPYLPNLPTYLCGRRCGCGPTDHDRSRGCVVVVVEVMCVCWWCVWWCPCYCVCVCVCWWCVWWCSCYQNRHRCDAAAVAVINATTAVAGDAHSTHAYATAISATAANPLSNVTDELAAVICDMCLYSYLCGYTYTHQRRNAYFHINANCVEFATGVCATRVWVAPNEGSFC